MLLSETFWALFTAHLKIRTFEVIIQFNHLPFLYSDLPCLEQHLNPDVKLSLAKKLNVQQTTEVCKIYHADL